MWINLTVEEKLQYKKYCDNKFGTTIMFCETGEPMYFDADNNLINTSIIIDLLFNTVKN